MKNFSIETICETDNMFLPRRMVWSPDDSLLLLSSFCNEVRIIDSSLNTNLEKTFPRMVTDIVWYPGMRIENRASWAFASVCPHYPIELIDAGDGHQRGAYICQSGGDSTASLTCLAFCGASILAGCSRCIFSCDIVRQDRKGSMAAKFSGTALSIGCHPMAGVLASGTSTGDALLLDSRSFQQVCSWHPWRESHGIDSVVWADENLLLCSARLEDTVCALDVRQPSSAVSVLEGGRKSSRLVSLGALGPLNIREEGLPCLACVGNEKGPSRLYYNSKNMQCLYEKNEFIEVGDGPTPSLAVSGQGIIAAGSGAFRTVEDEEKDTVEFKPILKKFSMLKIKALTE